ncbi:helix-turn-helix transcriptional regulator [Sphingomonas aestuarii]
MAAEIVPILSALEDDQALSQVARLLLERNRAQFAQIAVSDRRSRASSRPQIGSAKSRHNAASGTDWNRRIGDRQTTNPETDFHSLTAKFGRGPFELSIDVKRAPTDTPFSNEALDELQMLGQPLIAAITARDKLRTALRDCARSRAVVEMVATPVLLFDTSGCLLEANSAGRTFLKNGDGLRLRSGRIYACRPQDMARFSRAMADLGAAAPDDTRAISIERDSGSPYMMTITKRLVADEQVLIGLIADPDARINAAMPVLRSLFGLGAAEAEIACAVARGLDPEAIARLRSTSLTTVRSQLKSITAKMGCSRQTEIVRIVMSVPALMSA